MLFVCASSSGTRHQELGNTQSRQRTPVTLSPALILPAQLFLVNEKNHDHSFSFNVQMSH